VKVEFQTTGLRVIFGLVAGALAGAIVVVGGLLIGEYLSRGVAYVAQYGPQIGAIIFVVAFVVWLLGLVLLGSPCWWLLHRMKMRQWRSAVILGGSMTAVVFMALQIPHPLGSGSSYSASDGGGRTVIDNALTAHGWFLAIMASLAWGCVGALIGLVVWRVAYRRA
jgi:hypothetical protein